MVPMGRSLRAATSEQQARNWRADFPVVFFFSFLSRTFFLKVSKVLAHGGMARPCSVMFLLEVVLWALQQFLTLYRLLEGCEWKQFGAICLEPQLWPDGVTTSTNNTDLHNFTFSQRPAGSSPQVPKPYTSTW